jgi:hypothetical protein
MSLGLARDSMLDLAEMAKKVEDGEYKTSIEYSEEDREELIELSSGKGSECSLSMEEVENNESWATNSESAALSLTNGLHQYDETSGAARPSPLESEGKTEDPEFMWDGKCSVASSIGSDTIMSDASRTNHGRYSGFHATDYDDCYQPGDYYSAYAEKADMVPSLLDNTKQSLPFWCCLFPWMSGDRMITVEEQPAAVEGKESLVNVSETSNHSNPSRNASGDDDETSTGSDMLDETSTGSDMFGEKLSEKDRQAVLARLRLAQPDAAPNGAPDTPDKPKEKGLLNGIHVPPEGGEASKSKTHVKSILKRSSKLSGTNLSSQTHQLTGEASRRRSLFPSYSETSKKKQDLNITFSPMARVMAVKSHKDMESEEKGSVWWQKSDYEGFRKTGRMITKAMLEGGSEIWLATNRSWQLPNQGRSTTLKHATSLAERKAAKNKGNARSKKEYEATRDKWWHKFGHSRRGLEHVASIDEGRQRQGNVRQAIRAVVEENRRQKAFLREDADKLRMVSLQHTTWARDLAMAAGASDADAVLMNFNDEDRKSREFYLLKFSRAPQPNASKSSSSQKSTTVPAFMRPARSLLTVQPNRLDANTFSQIRYRRTHSKKKVAPVPSSSSSPMAKKAAGFASGEEVANMSAVLTGMGPLPKSATTVGGA